MGGRFDQLCKLLQELDIESSFEVGANSGLFSNMLLEQKVVQRALGSDYDRGAINKGVMRNAGNQSIYFAVYNILDMTEAGNIRRVERFKSDIVIALALSHHLILTQKVRLQYMFDVLAEYTTKYILIEFMPHGLWRGEGEFPDVPEWYTLEWFKSEMSVRFNILKELQTECNRIAILGELRNR